jgi:uncharacterized phiE125 gp8 family phage protein
MIYYWGYPGGFPGTGPFGTYGVAYLWGAYVTYGTLSLTNTSPPQSFTEPFTSDEIKEYLKIPQRSPPDPVEDAFVSSLISAARSYAEIYIARDLCVKQYDLVYDYWMAYRIELPPCPLLSVDLFQYKQSDGSIKILAEGPDYIVDIAKEPAALMAPYNTMWPTFTAWPSSAILIRFTAGVMADDPWWSGEGAKVKAAMRLLISEWYNVRLPAGAPVSEWPFAVTAILDSCTRRRVY